MKNQAHKYMPIYCAAAALLLFGCSAKHHTQDVQDGVNGNFTLGEIQETIKAGMPSSAVVEALGSPNIITRDEAGREVWIYDRISTTKAASGSSGTLAGWGAGIGTSESVYLGNAVVGAGAGAVSVSQRSLTLVVKFDESHKVTKYSYNVSRF